MFSSCFTKSSYCDGGFVDHGYAMGLQRVVIRGATSGGCARRADRHAYGAGISDGLRKRKHNSLLRACYSIQMICLNGNRLQYVCEHGI